ncbi:hypothetical protein [Nocardioides jejuensis]|uniref:Uncharacterized protein n=1 Tax=Nocardioides jejuensis TaxID=2502782 RepID=A0A4R1BZ37_9ACTN|nr:hypothetical protein [Nocardioides jejuensis]TCJ22696.1 hypothetical protein EPD65_12140 [Nocardioides jejuensis]
MSPAADGHDLNPATGPLLSGRAAAAVLASVGIAPAQGRRGMLILRVGRGLDPRASWSPQELLSRSWPIAPLARWELKARSQREPIPCVITAAGFVAAGADIVGAEVDGDGRTVLRTTAPSHWWAALEGRRLPTGPGTSWMWWPRPSADGRIRLERRQSRLRRHRPGAGRMHP